MEIRERSETGSRGGEGGGVVKQEEVAEVGGVEEAAEEME